MVKTTLYRSVVKKENPISVYSIIKYKTNWLVFIPKWKEKNGIEHSFNGFYVIPKCIYLYKWYRPKNIIDAIIKTFKNLNLW